MLASLSAAAWSKLSAQGAPPQIGPNKVASGLQITKLSEKTRATNHLDRYLLASKSAMSLIVGKYCLPISRCAPSSASE